MWHEWLDLRSSLSTTDVRVRTCMNRFVQAM